MILQHVVRDCVNLAQSHLPQYADYETKALHQVFWDDWQQDRLRWVEQEDRVVGFVTFAMIACPQDTVLFLLGMDTEGPVLFIRDCVAAQPGVIWKLRAQLPSHRYIAWLHEGRWHAPKGWPEKSEVLEEVA